MTSGDEPDVRDARADDVAELCRFGDRRLHVVWRVRALTPADDPSTPTAEEPR